MRNRLREERDSGREPQGWGSLPEEDKPVSVFGCGSSALPTCHTCLCIKHSAALHHTSPHLLLRHSLRFFPKEKKKKTMPLQSSLSGKDSGSIQAESTQSNGKTFEQLRHECLQKGVLFEDPDFPANGSSLFFSQSVPVQMEWKRPTVSRHGAFSCSDVLFQSITCGTFQFKMLNELHAV